MSIPKHPKPILKQPGFKSALQWGHRFAFGGTLHLQLVHSSHSSVCWVADACPADCNGCGCCVCRDNPPARSDLQCLHFTACAKTCSPQKGQSFICAVVIDHPPVFKRKTSCHLQNPTEYVFRQLFKQFLCIFQGFVVPTGIRSHSQQSNFISIQPENMSLICSSK